MESTWKGALMTPIKTPQAGMVCPQKTKGKVVAYAWRRIGAEWPVPGWFFNSDIMADQTLNGCEIVRITIEPIAKGIK